MISIIITAYKEPRTIGRAIKSILENNLKEEHEILVVAPDEETLNIGREYAQNDKSIRIVKDNGLGKPAALNVAILNARGEILVLTDGDVYIDKNALHYLLDPLKDKKVGAVSGNPISLNSKSNMLGYWSYMLTNIANERRLRALNLKKRFFCSGYLFAIRKNIFPKLPENLLSEDGFVSHKVYQSGYRIAYSPEAKVFVKYPTNFNDWIKQKKRSAGGYNQIKNLIGIEIRSFKKESLGFSDFFKYMRNLKEIFWLFNLFLARIYLWLVIYKDINLKKKPQQEIWQRVESTK